MTTEQLVRKVFCIGCVFLKGDKYCDCVIYNESRFVARAARKFVKIEKMEQVHRKMLRWRAYTQRHNM